MSKDLFFIAHNEIMYLILYMPNINQPALSSKISCIHKILSYCINVTIDNNYIAGDLYSNTGKIIILYKNVLNCTM